MANYLSYSDPVEEETRILSIQILTFLVDVSKERIAHHAKDVIEPTLRLIYELSRESTDKLYRQKLLDTCIDCLVKISSHAPKEFRYFCSGLDALSVNPIFDSAIQKAFVQASSCMREDNTEQKTETDNCV